MQVSEETKTIDTFDPQSRRETFQNQEESFSNKASETFIENESPMAKSQSSPKKQSEKKKKTRIHDAGNISTERDTSKNPLRDEEMTEFASEESVYEDTSNNKADQQKLLTNSVLSESKEKVKTSSKQEKRSFHQEGPKENRESLQSNDASVEERKTRDDRLQSAQSRESVTKQSNIKVERKDRKWKQGIRPSVVLVGIAPLLFIMYQYLLPHILLMLGL